MRGRYAVGSLRDYVGMMGRVVIGARFIVADAAIGRTGTGGGVAQNHCVQFTVRGFRVRLLCRQPQ